jgi:hypothetical protein
MKVKNRVPNANAMAYATDADFCEIFSAEMNKLYLLGFLLTANSEKAERCYLASLEECTKANHVFKEWADSWSRRMIVQTAVCLVRPTPEHAHETPPRPWQMRGKVEWNTKIDSSLASVLELCPFDRFVFVMSVLEKLSDHDCSLLLGCSLRDVIASRSRALECLASDMTLPASG